MTFPPHERQAAVDADLRGVPKRVSEILRLLGEEDQKKFADEVLRVSDDEVLWATYNFLGDLLRSTEVSDVKKRQEVKRAIADITTFLEQLGWSVD